MVGLCRCTCETASAFRRPAPSCLLALVEVLKVAQLEDIDGDEDVEMEDGRDRIGVSTLSLTYPRGTCVLRPG